MLKLIINLVFLVSACVYGDILFTAQVGSAKTTGETLSEKTYRECLLQVHQLPFYTSSADDVTQLIETNEALSPIAVKIEHANLVPSSVRMRAKLHPSDSGKKETPMEYLVIGCICQKESSMADNALAFFFLLRDNHLIAIALTDISTKNAQTLRFVSFNDWADYDNMESSLAKNPVNAKMAWDKWMTYISVQFETLRNKKRQEILKLFQAQKGEIEIESTRGYTIYEYTCAPDLESEPPYFQQGYCYQRNTNLLFKKGNLISVTHYLGIDPCILPEDGSTDPLDLEDSYLLLKTNKSKKSCFIVQLFLAARYYHNCNEFAREKKWGGIVKKDAHAGEGEPHARPAGPEGSQTKIGQKLRMALTASFL